MKTYIQADRRDVVQVPQKDIYKFLTDSQSCLKKL